jgi:moderate conductance mechanosensitive channel
MVRFFFLLLTFFLTTDGLASGSFSLPDTPPVESSPQSKEINKIAKLLEDPAEREKLVKTLKVLAAAQEKEEEKESRSLLSYIMPIVQFSVDTGSSAISNLKKVSSAIDAFAVEAFVDYVKIEKNRNFFWAALLMWLPILIFIEVILERLFLWFLRRIFETRKPTEKAKKRSSSRINYACAKLFLPFLCPMLFLPFYVTNESVRNWIVTFWVILFTSRLFILERKAVPMLAIGVTEEHSFMTNLWKWFVAYGLALLLFFGLSSILWNVENGRDFFLTPVLLTSFPFFIFGFREWNARGMPGYLDESRSLSTVPKKLAILTNICIRYLPIVLLGLMIPLVIDWIFFEGSLWRAYGVRSFITLLVLGVFLEGRRAIDALVNYQIPKFKTFNIQGFASHVAPLLIPFSKSVQWGWHFLFFASLMASWNYYFSGFFMSIFSHPLMKTITTLAILWGIVGLLLLGLDSFVHFHTTPQNIKGKRREPTVFAKTFGPMLHSVARWIIVLVATFITLESFGFDLKVLVYLMSAFAFAISLGSQNLVKDIINGFFALIDGSFAVGDVVTIGSYTGTVESLSLKSITLRHGTGFLQTIPFSEVGNIINKSRNYNVVPIDVATSYRTEIGSVYEALTKAAEDMTNHPTFGKMILEPLSVSGVDRFADTAVHVSASIKILPNPQNSFAREFNRRLKIHMDALKIVPPIAFQEPWENS